MIDYFCFDDSERMNFKNDGWGRGIVAIGEAELSLVSWDENQEPKNQS